MTTEHHKHPCETVEAEHEVMKLAGMILSDCGCSTAISDRLQRRVAGRIQLHMDSVAQQLELERGRLFAESQRKQQLQDQVGALLAAMDVIALGELPDGKYANISTMMYAEEACKAAKRAPIKESLTADQQAEPVALSLPFFAYDSETGFERFATEAKAKAAAQESIDTYREEAGEGWAEAVENICWGVVLGTTREVALPDNYDGAFGLADAAQFVDYMLTDAAQPPAVAVPGVKQNIGTLPVKDRHFLCRCEKCGWLGSSEECRESINHMYGDGDYYCPACGANGPDEMYEAEATFNAMLAAAPQAALPAPTIKLGLYGRAFDSPQTRRAYTYREQPDNIGAYKLGRAVLRAAAGGDSIDYGLSLLKQLQAEGFGVFELGDQQEGGA